MKVLFSSKGRRNERTNTHLFGCAEDTPIYVTVGCGAVPCNGVLGKSVSEKVKLDIIWGRRIKTQMRRAFQRHFHKLQPESVVSEICFFLSITQKKTTKGSRLSNTLRTIDFNKARHPYIGGTIPKSYWPGSLSEAGGEHSTPCSSLCDQESFSQSVSCELHNPLVVRKRALSCVGRGDLLRHWLCDSGHGRRHKVSNDSRILDPSLPQALLSLLSTKKMERKIYPRISCAVGTPSAKSL